MEIKIKSAAWHRNGVGGVGFYAITFECSESGSLVASLFDEPGYCAVYGIKKLSKGNVEFGENSFRGDVYESLLRPALKVWLEANDTGRLGPFSIPKMKRKETK